jgi:DNA-binding NarL/FixJ family response regulator
MPERFTSDEKELVADKLVPLSIGSPIKRAAKPRLLMADDHTLVLEAIGKLLEKEFDLVGTVGYGHALLQAAKQLRPDVILLDTSMPLLNGIDACRQLVQLIPETRVVFLTMHADIVYVEEALRAGASGYLVKWSAASELSTAIESVMSGSTYVTPLIPWERSVLRSDKSSSEKLSRRQREVLQLVAEGRANKEIAALLHVSEKTVDYHKSSIKRLLMINSTAELTQFAIKHRIIGA